MLSRLVTLLLFTMPLHATPQAGDQLILENGTKKSVHNFDLGKTAEKKLDAWKVKKGYSGVSSTANYDGFYATLQIKDGKLLLTKIEVDAHSDWKGFFHAEVPISAIFDGKGPIAADWFTGELWEFFGDREGYTPFKSHVRIYVFTKGRLVGTKVKKSSELK